MVATKKVQKMPLHASSHTILVGLSSILAVQAATVLEATATIRSSDHPDLSGYVTFHHVDGTNPLSGVVVDVSMLSGVPPGRHGFHIHQFGDSTSAETVGGHFIPLCGFRRARALDGDADVTNPSPTLECGSDAAGRKCACDEIHGFPPSTKRMPGDMGNLDCAADGTCVLCFEDETVALNNGCSTKKTLGQEKMSLSYDLRSIIGRSLGKRDIRN